MADFTPSAVSPSKSLPANAWSLPAATAPAKPRSSASPRKSSAHRTANSPFPAAIRKAAGNSRPGYVAHTTMVYDELTAEENLLLFAKLQKVEAPAARAEELLREVGLYERRASLVRTFSRGMRQRIAIARALIHRPSVFCCFDEPATGLDPLRHHLARQFAAANSIALAAPLS